MERKHLVLAAIVAAAAVMALLGGRLDSDAFAITGFMAGNEKEGRQSLMPADRITEDSLRASEDAVLIRIANATIGKLEGTNSMAPLLGKNSTAIMIVPGKENDIRKGDIIAYHSEEAGGLVAHRVVEVGNDEQGWFAITKGDNAKANDPEKARFWQVKYAVVGILY